MNKISVQVKSAALEIEWREFYDLRNFIVHAYWQVDLEIVAAVVATRLEPFFDEIDTLIAVVERSET